MLDEFDGQKNSGLEPAELGVGEEENYSVKRKALMALLQLHCQALFRLLEHYRALEKQAETQNATVPMPQISWEYGRNTQQMIDLALRGLYMPIHVDLQGSDYDVVSWQYGLDMSDPENITATKGMNPQEKFEYLNQHSRGSSDLRISLDGFGDQERSLKFFANVGHLASMDQDFHQAFDIEPYPVICQDRHGYHYENPAFTARLEARRP